MSDVMSKVPEDHPLMKAWKAHQETADFANSKRWAAVPNHLQGSLWTLFMAGFNAGFAEGRRQGLEEAAKIADDDWRSARSSKATAAAIRALIKEPKT